MNDVKIGVIGSSGFIGSNYVNHLIAEEYNVVTGDIVTGDIDIRHESSVEAWFSTHLPDRVILTAAVIRQQEIFNEPVNGMDTNITGVLNVLNACRKYNCMLIFSSTVHVYEGMEGVVSEKSIINSNQPKHLYTQSKIIAEELIRSYNALYGVDYLIFRYGVLYGHGGHQDMVVNRFISLANNGEAIQIHGNGMQQRCFVHINDLCDAMLLSMKNNTKNTTINICESVCYTIIDIANIISDYVDLEAMMIPSRKCDLSSPVVLNDRARRLLGWKPYMSLEKYIKSGLKIHA